MNVPSDLEVPPDLLASFPDAAQRQPGLDEPDLNASGRDDDVGAADFASLHTMLDDEGRGGLAQQSTVTRWAMAAGLVVAIVMVVMLGTRRADLGVYPGARMALDVALSLTPLVLAIAYALRPITRPEPPLLHRLLVVAAGVASVVLIAALPMAHGDHPASLEGIGDEFFARARGCFAFGLSFAAVAMAGLSVLRRNRGGRWGWMPGPLAVWAAGLIGLIALYWHCPVTHPRHLWAGHATVIVPALIVAWALRRRLDG